MKLGRVWSAFATLSRREPSNSCSSNTQLIGCPCCRSPSRAARRCSISAWHSVLGDSGNTDKIDKLRASFNGPSALELVGSNQAWPSPHDTLALRALASAGASSGTGPHPLGMSTGEALSRASVALFCFLMCLRGYSDSLGGVTTTTLLNQPPAIFLRSQPTTHRR